MYEDQAKVLQRKEEEWQTMQSNYEEQLSVISDHLAEMNTRLASQEWALGFYFFNSTTYRLRYDYRLCFIHN